MGGYGSGFQGCRKATVEDGLTLCVNDLVRKGAIIPGSVTRGGWRWSYAGRPLAHIGYETDMRHPGLETLRLTYTTEGQSVNYLIWLVSTTPYFGGKRWWFVCPLVRRDGKPPPRVAKLHRPRGARYFGSRRAYDLTYTSCRESGQFRSIYNSIAAEVGLSPEAVRAALKRKVT